MLGVLKNYFKINLSDYENIGISLEINKAVLVAFVALIVGIVLLNRSRGVTRLVVMQLTRHGATSEDKAKTISELGLAESRAVKKLLSGRNVLTRTVARCNATEYDYETYRKMDKKARDEAEKIDFATARFYIREEGATRAAFIVERYTVTLTRTVATCVLVAIIGGCVFACMPSILSILNELIGMAKI